MGCSKAFCAWLRQIQTKYLVHDLAIVRRTAGIVMGRYDVPGTEDVFEAGVTLSHHLLSIINTSHCRRLCGSPFPWHPLFSSVPLLHVYRCLNSPRRAPLSSASSRIEFQGSSDLHFPPLKLACEA